MFVMNGCNVEVRQLGRNQTKIMCWKIFLLWLLPGQFIPKLESDAAGSNFFDSTYKMLNILVRGSTPVEIRTSPLLFISFQLPAMTEEEFFGDNLVKNLALFLKIPPSMIRISKVVREGQRRRRRATGLTVEVVISQPPVQQATNTTNGKSSDSTQLLITLLQATIPDILNPTRVIIVFSFLLYYFQMCMWKSVCEKLSNRCRRFYVLTWMTGIKTRSKKNKNERQTNKHSDVTGFTKDWYSKSLSTKLLLRTEVCI